MFEAFKAIRHQLFELSASPEPPLFYPAFYADRGLGATQSCVFSMKKIAKYARDTIICWKATSDVKCLNTDLELIDPANKMKRNADV